MKPIQKAINTLGSAAELARVCRLRPQNVSRWRRTGRTPADHCPAIESSTGIRCEQLRPDLVWTRDESGAVTGYHVRINH